MDWKALVRTVAPTLGAALGGPFGGAAVKFLADKFLGNPDASEQDVAAAVLGASPEKLLEIKKLDNEFKIRMKELDIDVFRIEVDDRKSARQREVSTGDVWTPRLIATCVIVAWGYVQYHILNHSIPPDMRELVARVLGMLDASMLAVLYYYFGASKNGNTTVVNDRRG